MILRKVLVLLVAFASVMLAANSVAAATKLAPGKADAPIVDFAGPDPVLQLGRGLSPYHAPGGRESDGSLWYLATVSNPSGHAVTRLLLAEESAGAALHFFPRPTRAAILQAASSDGAVTVERERALGRYAYRVTLPPATTAALALRLGSADARPAVLAWNEPALVAYRDRLSIFIAAVAGLIAAAVVITGGLAAMTGHAAPRWAAVTLLAVLVAWLGAVGFFDAGWSTAVGGPYGFTAMAAGLALAAGIRLAEEASPLSDLWPWAEKYRRWGFVALVALSLLAFIGLPGATLGVNIVVVFGAAGLAAYLVRRGVTGARPARVLAPGATVFALVTLAAAVVALGGFQDNLMAPQLAGGFAAAGAVLLALAVAAAEGTAVLPLGKTTVSAGRLTPELPEPIAAVRVEPKADGTPPAALLAIGASHQGVFDLDFRTDSLKLSAEAAGLLGFERVARSIAHSAWVGRVHPEDRSVYKEALRDYRGSPGLAFRIEFRARSESGRYPWFELRATMLDEGEMAERCLGLIADVTARKEAEAAAVERVLHDPLTGVGNRVALMEELDRIGRDIALVALLDIDRFKTIHVSLGDAGADAVLQHVAARLMEHFGTRAHVFRVGGDGFALLFGDGDAEGLGAELVDLCAKPYMQNGRRIFAPASVGLAHPSAGDEPLDLLRYAELAVREAKRQGGGRCCLYSADLALSAPGDAVALEADLRKALEEDQIDIFYQPIMRLSDRTVAGFEALLRWHHPERGLVWPSDFVTHSEESGLIVELGRFALIRAAEELARWQQHFPVEPPIFVSVNVSRRQLQDADFEGFLAEVLKRTPVTAGSLRLEITESAVAADSNVGERLKHIHALGAGFAIDDFGAGLSALSQLRTIPFDSLKIDKSFLSRCGDGANDGDVILGSIIAMARELKRGIVVEGVESEEEARRLMTMGCEYAQGFLFSVPLTAREALNFIALHYNAEGHRGSGVSGVGSES